MAGVVTFLMGHDSKIELAGSRMMGDGTAIGTTMPK
jgi:hypothetical protein